MPTLTKSEQQELLTKWNDTKTDFPKDKCIHQLFEEQVEQTPDAVAAVFEDKQMTYLELNQQANQLAHYLRSSGVTPETLVGIYVERSFDMIVGILGILKAGGAYVPLDPTYPKERLVFMIKDTNVPIILVQKKLAKQLKIQTTQDNFSGLIFELDSDGPTVNEESKETPVNKTTSDNLTYIMYTSGSTGMPKGVCVNHRGVVRLVKNTNYVDLNAEHVFLQLAPIAFDAATFEIWGCLLNGGKLVIMSPKPPSLKELGDALKKHHITTLWLTSGLFHLMVDKRLDDLQEVRQLLAGGDVLAVSHVKKVLEKLKGCRLINGYGPTENTTFTCCYSMDNPDQVNDFVPVGSPISNTQAYILDDQCQQVPIGDTGELHAGGDGLAISYLNHPELTAERFITHSFSNKPNVRLYKTGDLARYLPDGNLGRLDNQVKLRGFRIELGEIEAKLIQHLSIQETVVIVREDTPGDKRLVAYIVTQFQQAISNNSLRTFVQSKLPEYMVPSVFVQLDALPLTPNGKIDRKVLPQPEIKRADLDNVYIPPQNENEEKIATVFKDVLQMDKVGIKDNFFDLGANSLLLVQISAKLSEALAQKIPVLALLQYPTIKALVTHLTRANEQAVDKHTPDEDKAQAEKRKSTRNREKKGRNQLKYQRNQENANNIAIIGLSGRFPGADTTDLLWQNIKNGVESIRFFSDKELIASGTDPADLSKTNYIKAKGFVERVDEFDAVFFNMSAAEARITDPQRRLFLACAWETLESAGYAIERYPGVISVYGGVGSFNTYLLENLYNHSELRKTMSDFQIMLANSNDFVTTQVSYRLNLTGPSMTVQTACSTSLVAVVIGCQSLLNHQCDMALAGGAAITLPTKSGYLYQEGMISSPDGHCRAFDAKAQGTVSGNGAGMVLLKRLDEAQSDGDHIYAVIKGAAMNNDGAQKVAFSAPSVDAQSRVISEALSLAGVEAESISYIETHGTGTPLGDPIEIAALTQAYRAETDKEQFCAIGSLKTNIGHLDAASGISGLIKTVLSLHHQTIPPSLHFETPNPKLNLESSPFYVNTKCRTWDTGSLPRRAGVSSFGIGGTNAHIILEEAPPRQATQASSRTWHLLILSAKTETALKTATDKLTAYLKQHDHLNLADVAYTLQIGRNVFSHRRTWVCQNIEDKPILFSRICQESHPDIVFMFSGQGAQYANMGQELYQTEPLFQKTIDHCAKFLNPLIDCDLRRILYGGEGNLQQTAMTQPALFVIEYAVAMLWMSWGVKPYAMIGHSVGEIVAACLANVMTLDEALTLVGVRGRLLQSMPSGAMLAVSLSEGELLPLLTENVDLAAVNMPSQCVVSGPFEAIEAFMAHLTKQEVECTQLHTSHAFHSTMMIPVLDDFLLEVQKIQLKPPQVPFVSNVTGTWISDQEATDPRYWVKHVRQTVRFSDGLQEILRKTQPVLLEVGPGRTLASFAKRHQDRPGQYSIYTSLRHPKDQDADSAFLLTTLGQLWMAGVDIDWSALHKDRSGQRVPLPTYSFDYQSYWITPANQNDNKAANLTLSQKNTQQREDMGFGKLLHSRSNLTNNYVAPDNDLEQNIINLWQNFLGIEPIGIHDDFFDLGGDSLLAIQVITQLKKTYPKAALSSHSLLNASTTSKLAASILKIPTSKDAKFSEILVEIQSGQPYKTPLFLMHPVGGHVYFYKDLASSLGDAQPVYGLQALGADGKTQPLTTVEKMATQYIQAIRTIQPEGPYYLGGSSFGGMIAYEMAQQLHALKQEVALLTMLDTPAKDKLPPKMVDDAEILAYLLNVGEDNTDISMDELRQLSGDKQLEYFLSQGKITKSLLPATTVAQLRQFLLLLKINNQAMFDYQPKPYSGNIIFFRAHIRNAINLANPESGWLDIAKGGVKVYEVPGNHITMNYLPNVNAIANELKKYLEKTNTFPDRKMGFFEALMIRMHEQLQGHGSVATTTRVKGTISFSDFKQALNLLFERHPPLRATAYAKNNAYYFNFNAQFNNIPITFVQTDDKHVPHQLLTQEAAQPFELSKYLWRAYLVSNNDHEHDIVLGCSHAISDGMSLANLNSEILVAIQDTQSNQLFSLPRLPLLPSMEALITNKNTSNEIEEHAESVNILHLKNKYNIDNAHSCSIIRTLKPAQMNKITQACREYQITINSALNIALFKALMESQELKELNAPIFNAVNVRPMSEGKIKQENLGGYASNIEIKISCKETSDFWELTKKFNATLSAALINQDILIPINPDISNLDRVIKLMKEKRDQQIFPLQYAVLSNLGKIDNLFSKISANHSVQDFRFTILNPAAVYGVNLFVSTLENKMNLVFTFTEPMSDINWIEKLADLTCKILINACDNYANSQT